MATIARLVAKVTLDNDQYVREVAKVERESRKLARSFENVGKSLLPLTATLTAAGAATLKLAVDAEETRAKYTTVFGEMSGAMDEFIASVEDTIPATREQLEGMLSGLQDLLVPMGVVPQAAAQMSQEFTSLAADLASFNNIPIDEALVALRAGIVGSSEPLQRFGVDVRQAAVETKALELGLIRQGDAITNAVRAQAVLAIATEESTFALGDAARTADSAANQMRFLVRDIKELGTEIGRELIPLATKLVAELRVVVSWFRDLDAEQRKLVVTIGLVVAAAGPMLILFGKLVRVVGALRAAMTALAGVRAMGLLAALMSPTGAIIVGAGVLAGLMLTLRDRTKEWTEETTKLVGEQEELRTSITELSKAELEAAIRSQAASIANVQAQRAEAEAKLANLRARPESQFGSDLGALFGSGSGLVPAPSAEDLNAITQAQTEIRTLGSEISNLGEQERALFQTQQQLADQLVTIGQVAGSGGGGGAGAAKGVEDLTDALDNLETVSTDTIRALAGIGGEGGIADPFTEAEKALEGITTNSLPQFVDGVDEAGDELEEARQRARELQDTMGGISQAAQSLRSAVDLGGVLGILDTRLQSVANSLVNAGQGIAGIVAGIGAGAGAGGLIGAGIGAAVGIANAIKGLFGGGGPSFADLVGDAMDRLAVQFTLLTQDTERLRAAFEQLGPELVGSLEELGTQMFRFAQRIETIPGTTGQAGPDEAQRRAIDALTGAFNGVLRNSRDVQQLNQLLSELGISFFDLNKAAGALGLPINNLLQLLITGEGDFASATAELKLFIQGIQAVATEAKKAQRQFGPGIGGGGGPVIVDPNRPILLPPGAPPIPAPPIIPPINPVRPGPSPVTPRDPAGISEPFQQFPQITEVQADEVISVLRTIETHVERGADAEELYLPQIAAALASGGTFIGTVNQQLAANATIGAP